MCTAQVVDSPRKPVPQAPTTPTEFKFKSEERVAFYNEHVLPRKQAKEAEQNKEKLVCVCVCPPPTLQAKCSTALVDPNTPRPCCAVLAQAEEAAKKALEDMDVKDFRKTLEFTAMKLPGSFFATPFK